MHCPRCHEPTRVLETRSADGGAALRRRRACASCDHRFTTFERREPEPLYIRKRDGERQRFEPAKLRGALMRAIHKRPIDPRALDGIVQQAAGEIDAAGGELRADHLADFCLRELERLDRGAYLQYAGTLPEQNAEFALAGGVAEAERSVRGESDHG